MRYSFKYNLMISQNIFFYYLKYSINHILVIKLHYRCIRLVARFFQTSQSSFEIRLLVMLYSSDRDKPGHPWGLPQYMVIVPVVGCNYPYIMRGNRGYHDVVMGEWYVESSLSGRDVSRRRQGDRRRHSVDRSVICQQNWTPSEDV